MFTQLLDALTAPHGTDRYLEILRPTWSRNDPRAEIVAVERRGTGSVTLRLRPNASWGGFRAGQFIRVGIEIGGVRETRCYSPACSEQRGIRGGEIEITVRAHPEGKVSNHLHEHARPGMFVELSEADGDFVLPANRPRAPAADQRRQRDHAGDLDAADASRRGPRRRDRLPSLLARRWRRRATTPSSRRSQRRAPNVRVIHAHTRTPGSAELDGHLTRAHFEHAIGDHSTADAYVCGPPALIEAARGIYLDDGLAERLHVESFLPPTLAIATDAAEGTLTFADSGAAVANDGRTLLEQAEAAGLNPDFGCRMGICHTCTCKKTAGAVRNALTGEVSDAEDEDIQICVSVPVDDCPSFKSELHRPRPRLRLRACRVNPQGVDS